MLLIKMSEDSVPFGMTEPIRCPKKHMSCALTLFDLNGIGIIGSRTTEKDEFTSLDLDLTERSYRVSELAVGSTMRFYSENCCLRLGF